MTRRDWRAVLAVCALLTATLAAAPAGAVHDADRQFSVNLHAGGNATVVFEHRYNLSVAAERDRFRRLANNTTALQERRAAFARRLRAAAANGSQRTARNMSIRNVTATTRRANGTGIVAFRARWIDLAGVYGAQLVVNEPFSTSFDPNATLIVRGPEGYVREQVSPPPAIARLNSAFWAAETDLDGFSARFIDPDATTSAADGDGGSESTPPPEPSGIGRLIGAAGFALIPALLVLFGAKRRDLLRADSGENRAGGDDGDTG